MLSNQIIQKSIDELSKITKIDISVYETSGKMIVTTSPETGIEKSIVASFSNSMADTREINGINLFRVQDEGKDIYILSTSGEKQQAYMTGRIAVSQLEALMIAYKEKYDRNNFFQNLILDNLLLVDIYNRAKKLHLEIEAKRVVYVVETAFQEDVTAIELLRGLFTSHNGDFVVSVDEKNIVLIKNLEDTSEEAIVHSANVIVDMLNTEAMMNVRVAYGNVVNELREVSKSYKEAKMALDVGKIFYAEKNVIGYGKLGIGRLIYQLPVNLCEMFMKEIFGIDIPVQIDEEILTTVLKFFENSLNISETARQLYIHRNTLVYRIEKVQKETGLDIRNFEDALTFKIALMVSAYLKYRNLQDK